MEGVAVYGLSSDEIIDALKKNFPNKTIKFQSNLSNNNISLASKNNEVYGTKIIFNETESSLLAKLESKQRDLKNAEESCHKAASSIQALHKQQQALFDEFVILRQKYDEQKLSMINILWNQCSAYHPDLRQIPQIEDDNDFEESDEKVGNYHVGEMLGEGQFATVKSCILDGTQDEYALKIIKKERITSFTSLTRVSNEIESLKLLKSKYIIGINEVIHTKQVLYIITEKGGYDLFEFFDEHPDGVPEVWAKQILTCILKGVMYTHEQQICHRDLKPENILLTFNSKAGCVVDLKLCDFGLSTKFKPKVPLTDFCGSPGFFAPEMIITGNYYGEKADIWSVGCILLELVLGHERFCDIWMTSYDYEILQDKEKFTKTIEEAVETLPDVLNFSPELNDFILKILQLRSSKRQSTPILSTHSWLEGSMDSELAKLRANKLTVDIPLSPTRSPNNIEPLYMNNFQSSSTSRSHSESFTGSGDISFNNFQVNPEFLKAAFDNLSEKERRHMEEYILAHKGSIEFGESHHHLSLPPIEPATPSIGKAKKILRKGDELAHKAKELDGSVSHGNEFSTPNRSSFRAHSPLPGVSENNEVHFSSETKGGHGSHNPHLRSQSKDSMTSSSAAQEKKSLLQSSYSDNTLLG
eukprot:gene6770-9273_t